MSGKYSYDAAQAGMSTALNKYSSWKTSTSSSADFKTYMQLFATKSLSDSFQQWENILEGGGSGDGVKGNTISFEHFYETENNKLVFQAKNGDITGMNFETGKVANVNEEDLAKANGVKANAATGDRGYDVMEIGENSLVMKEYAFTGLGDGKADVKTSLGGKLVYEELDLAKDPTRISDIIASYEERFGKAEKLQDIFGTEDGRANAVVFSANGQNLVSVQAGKGFAVDNKGNVRELNVRDFTSDKNITLESVSIGTDKNINAALKNTVNIIQKTHADDTQGVLLSAKITITNQQKVINGMQVNYETSTVNNTYKGVSNLNIGEAGMGAWGDPHYDLTGRDGQKINFDHQGTAGHNYRLFEGDNLKIDGLYSPWNGSATANIISEVSIKAGNDVLSYTAAGVLKLNGQEVSTAKPLKLPDGSQVIVSTGKITVIPNDGNGRVDITSQAGYLNIDPAGQFSGLGGIIGTAINNNKAFATGAEAEAYGDNFDLLTYKEAMEPFIA